uniref:Immunoglobulin V-set domain-containing protein n=1 Tax=Neolamprologus brichardi TaxID=32507 RepID=A0A3Q4G8N4_NEOBR
MTSARFNIYTYVTFSVLHTGLTDGSDVEQTPTLWEREGKSATMQCNHTKDFTYSYMYWFRQLPGETMTLIVFATTGKKDNEHDYGNFDKEKFSASKPVVESGTFIVKNLKPEDKGWYFFLYLRKTSIHSRYFNISTDSIS